MACVGMLAVSVSACTGGGAEPAADDAVGVEPAEAGPRPAPTTALPSGEIGSGSFTSAAGVTGRVTFEHGEEGLTVRFVDLGTGGDDVLNPNLLRDALGPDETCLDGGSDLGLGAVRGGDSSVGLGSALQDPSNIEQVVLTREPRAGVGTNDCIREVVARAGITWSFAPLRSGLRVVDSGPTGGARGHVGLIDGEPATYTVAADDLLGEVAARVGISLDDLLYLNPSFGDSPYRELLVGETLNLAVAGR